MAAVRPKITELRGGGWVSGGVNTQASKTTALTGNNNDLTYTSKLDGADGNDITVTYVVAGANTPLSVSVATHAITVNVATNASSVATSTAAQVRDAVNGNAAASSLVVAQNAAGNDGTGVVAAMAAITLTGGAETLFRTGVTSGGASWKRTGPYGSSTAFFG